MMISKIFIIIKFYIYFVKTYPASKEIKHPENKKGISGILVFMSIFFNNKGITKIKAAVQNPNKNPAMENKYPYNDEKKIW
jgi:hypothetical protein